MIGPHGCQRLFLGLQHNHSLLSLDVSENQLSSYHLQDNYSLSTIQAISEGLANNKVLMDLNMANNGLFGTYYDTQSESSGTYMRLFLLLCALSL